MPSSSVCSDIVRTRRTTLFSTATARSGTPSARTRGCVERDSLGCFQQFCSPHGRQEIPLHVRQSFSHNRRSRHEDHANRLTKVVLMQPEGFPQQAARATADDRRAEFATGNDAKARLAFGPKNCPIGNQTAIDQPLALLPDFREITPLLQTHGPREPKRRPFGGHTNQTGVNRLRPTRRRFLRMARPLFVELRLRNPCWRLRRIFDGWYCRFMQ